MFNIYSNKSIFFFKKCFHMIMLVAFLFCSIVPISTVSAQNLLNMPQPGVPLSLSPQYQPALIQGLTLYPENPLKFDFIVDSGDSGLDAETLKADVQKMIRYFLAALTVPEDEMWVNLSPYEKDRIIADGLSQTELGRDLLTQDYVLKQLMASLMYPESDLGKKFWSKIYSEAQRKLGTTEVSVETFNKVWIVPDTADVIVQGNHVFVMDSKFKVLLDKDYLASEKNQDQNIDFVNEDLNKSMGDFYKNSQEIIKDILIPVIEKEVNEGESFAVLRQVFNSMILATWYKENIKQSFLTQEYVDQNKLEGIDFSDSETKNFIYKKYVKAFETGVYDYIREDYDKYTDTVTLRKYFSGGISGNLTVSEVDQRASVSSALGDSEKFNFSVELQGIAGAAGSSSLGISSSGSEDLALLARESSVENFEKAWQVYIKQEGLDQYPDIVSLMTDDVKMALLDSPSLRPIFLIQLQENQMEELEVAESNQALLNEKVGDQTLLEYVNKYSAFKVGNIQDAQNVLDSGAGEIVVGVGDRPTDGEGVLTMLGFGPVAHGRTAHFPLPDGTALAVKGLGQFNNDQSENFADQGGGQGIEGLLLRQDMSKIIERIGLVDASKGYFIQYLGYRVLKAIPRKAGSFLTIDFLKKFFQNYDLEKNPPILMFHRVQSIHRLIKIPQLLSTDRELIKLRKSISPFLQDSGDLPEGQVISFQGLQSLVLLRRARNEAIRQNLGLYKAANNYQDYSFLQEADLNELIVLDEYVAKLTVDYPNRPELAIFVRDSGLDFFGLRDALRVLILTHNAFRAHSKGFDVVLDDVLRDFLSEYFNVLDEDNIQKWRQQIQSPEMLDRLLQDVASEDAEKQLTSEGLTQLFIDQLNASSSSVGGIDLNSNQLKLRVKGEFSFQPLPVNYFKENEFFKGFNPVILNVEPVTIPMLLGLDDEEGFSGQKQISKLN